MAEIRCVMCDLERELRSDSDRLRAILSTRNPALDLDWDDLFRALAEVDSIRKMLRGSAHA
jgi:hypothetical protein